MSDTGICRNTAAGRSAAGPLRLQRYLLIAGVNGDVAGATGVHVRAFFRCKCRCAHLRRYERRDGLRSVDATVRLVVLTDAHTDNDAVVQRYSGN